MQSAVNAANQNFHRRLMGALYDNTPPVEVRPLVDPPL